jgi:hypothetical protein
VLGELQTFGAIHEERGIALRQVEPSRVHFSEERNQVSCCVSFLGGGGIQISEELFVGQAFKGSGVHDPVVASQFLQRDDAFENDFHRTTSRPPVPEMNIRPAPFWSELAGV